MNIKFNSSQPNFKSIISSVVGTIVESYDLLLYMHLIPILTPLFFVNQEIFSARLIAVITISATLVMRPIGSIYFGCIGDKYGRKRGLFFSIIFMIIPTFIISILPVYNKIYIWAPITLILCRLLQSFAMGGETGGANTVLVESSGKKLISTTTSLLYSSIMMGGVLATIATYCVSIDLFNWRIAFLIGALFGIIGFYIRYKTIETAPFKHCITNKLLLKNPWNNIITNNKKEILSSFLMSFCAVVPFHLNYVYMVDFLRNTLDIPIAKISIINMATQIFSIVFMPVFGFIADKNSKKILMIISLSILLFISYPLILYNNMQPSILCSIIIQITLSLCLSMYSGSFFTSISLLFPTNKRFTATGFSISLGVSIFSFISSIFLWGSHENNLFLYSIIPMLFFGFLNFKIVLRDLKLKDPT